MPLAHGCATLLSVFTQLCSSSKVILEYNLMIHCDSLLPSSSTSHTLKCYSRVLELRGSLLKGLYILAASAYSPPNSLTNTALHDFLPVSDPSYCFILSFNHQNPAIPPPCFQRYQNHLFLCQLPGRPSFLELGPQLTFHLREAFLVKFLPQYSLTSSLS